MSMLHGSIAHGLGSLDPFFIILNRIFSWGKDNLAFGTIQDHC